MAVRMLREASEGRSALPLAVDAEEAAPRRSLLVRCITTLKALAVACGGLALLVVFTTHAEASTGASAVTNGATSKAPATASQLATTSSLTQAIAASTNASAPASISTLLRPVRTAVTQLTTLVAASASHGATRPGAVSRTPPAPGGPGGAQRTRSDDAAFTRVPSTAVTPVQSATPAVPATAIAVHAHTRAPSAASGGGPSAIAPQIPSRAPVNPSPMPLAPLGGSVNLLLLYLMVMSTLALVLSVVRIWGRTAIHIASTYLSLAVERPG